jgi:uncharacterized protein YggE
MTRPRTITLALSAVLAGAAFSGLGIASADTSSTATNTIVVNGSDTISIDPSSSDATEQATYQTALGDAITNAKTKATFIATQIGATLDAVTNVTETSDSGGQLCQGPILYAAGSAKPGTTSTPSTGKHKHKAALVRTAVIDPVNQCSIEADVTVTYDMTPA